MNPTTVIKVAGRDRDRLLADPDFVYVGRRFAGFEGSTWGNPFRPGMGGLKAWRVIENIPPDDLRREGKYAARDKAFLEMTAVEAFAFYVECRHSLMARTPELKGKMLGCWCGSWSPGEPDIGCHAVVLARMADASEGGASSRP